MTVSNEIFEQALCHHCAGRLAEAELGYRRVLTDRPDHSRALHLLGTIAFRGGNISVAIELIRRATVIDPTAADCWNDLGLALRSYGDLPLAADACRKA